MDIFYTTSKRKITNQLIQFRSSKHKEWKWSGVRQKTKMTAASSSWGISKHILVVAWTSHQSSVLKEWVIFKFMCLYKYWLHVLNFLNNIVFSPQPAQARELVRLRQNYNWKLLSWHKNILFDSISKEADRFQKKVMPGFKDIKQKWANDPFLYIWTVQFINVKKM